MYGPQLDSVPSKSNRSMLGDERLKCSEEQLIEALTGRTHPVHAQMLMLQLVQALLDERFHLRLHTAIRLTPVYVLVQAKSGAKVKEVSAPPPVEGDWMEAMKHYSDENPDKPFPGVITCSGESCTATAMTISGALGQIRGSSRAERMVIDETGLKGYYDFSFRNPAKDDDDAMGEIEEDLGMKFEARKVDLTTYVIDSAQSPTPN
jgi:uncharacterized protein (TIGR03435 family)